MTVGAGSASYFDPLIGHLDPDLVYCVSLDLPGHGASGEPLAPYTLDLVADATIAVADASRADTFVLLGFSMSAKFAQWVARRHPDRTVGQVLVAGCPTGHISLPAEMLQDWYGRAGDAAGLVDVAVSAAARVNRVVLEETLELCCTTDFRAEVAGSTVPTLVVGGTKDWIFTPDVLRQEVAGPLARAELRVLDCGHEIPVEAPQDLAELVTRFVRDLKGLPPRASQTSIAPTRRRGGLPGRTTLERRVKPATGRASPSRPGPPR